MKKIILSLLLVLSGFSLTAQTSSGTWNSRTATYTNDTFGVKWTLIDDVSWVGRPILTGSTLFKVRNDDTQIMVSIGVREADSPNYDIWNDLSVYTSDEMMAILQAGAKKDNMVLKSVQPVRSQVRGYHANKVRVEKTKYYSEYNTTVYAISYTYDVAKDGYIYAIAINGLSMLKEDIPDFDRIVTVLLDGFNFTK